jgi:hypothetical protein
MLAARESTTVNVRIPLDLKIAIERDAHVLRRFRLRAGRVPVEGPEATASVMLQERAASVEDQ